MPQKLAGPGDAASKTRNKILRCYKFPDDLFTGTVIDPGADVPAITPETITRECAGSSEIDDMGNEFERCPDNDHGHLYFHGWCVHCHSEEPE